MLSSCADNVNTRKLFAAASTEDPSPDKINPFLLQLFMPDVVSGIPIPDNNPTPHMMKSFAGETIISWVNSSAEMLAVWTPASSSNILKIFVRIPPDSWAFLTNIDLNQPLYENYRKARLAAAKLTFQSAAQAAGSFTLAGLMTGTDVSQLPPFSSLNYNSILSYIQNAGVSEHAVPVQKGITSVHQLNGYNEYYSPDSDCSIKVEDYWTAAWDQYTDGGWLPLGSSTPLPVGGGTTLWSTASANPKQGMSSVLPDPFYGYCEFKAEFDAIFSAVTHLRVFFEITHSIANAVTWVRVAQAVQVAQTRQTVPLAASDVHFSVSSGRIKIDGPITAVALKIVNDSGATSTMTFSAGNLSNIVNIISYDMLRPNVQSPAHLFIATQLNAGQPISANFTHILELIPNPAIAKVVPLNTNRPDEIYMEQTMAVLSMVGKGVKLMWQTEDYNRAIANSFFHALSRESVAYEAADPSLKSRLLDLWKRVNPYLSEAAITGGKYALRSILGNAGAIHPALGPVGKVISNEFLSAPPSAGCSAQAGPSGYREYSAADADFDVEPPPGQLSMSSDFLNIVNQKSGLLTNPRRSYFPVVPKSFDRETKVVLFTFSKDPQGAEFTTAYTPNGVKFNYNSFFETAEAVEFLGQLTDYAISCSIILKNTEVYFHVNFEPVDGSSWRLAALMAVLGIAGGAIYTGGVSFSNPLRPVLQPIGKLPSKAMLAKSVNRVLVAPASVADSEVAGVVSTVGPAVYAGYFSSGRPLPANMGVFLIESPWDCTVLGLRAFKHRLTMATDVQQEIQKQSAGYNPASKAPKPPSQSSAVLKSLPSVNAKIDTWCDEALAKIDDLGIQNPDLRRAVQRNREGWKAVCANQGNSEALNLQLKAISGAASKMLDKIDAYYRNSVAAATPLPAGTTKSAKQREKKKRAAARKKADEEGGGSGYYPESSGPSESRDLAVEALGL
jgi:hypothetical protein